MIKFQDVPYMRLNMDRFEQKFRSQLEEFKHAKSFGAAYYALLGLDLWAAMARNGDAGGHLRGSQYNGCKRCVL